MWIARASAVIGCPIGRIAPERNRSDEPLHRTIVLPRKTGAARSRIAAEPAPDHHREPTDRDLARRDLPAAAARRPATTRDQTPGVADLPAARRDRQPVRPDQLPARPAPKLSSGVLPVHAVLPELRRALSESSAAVLVAEPGAGKTTVVPLELLAEPWLAGRRIVMLEPRRLAARYAARRMAATLGEPVGRTVGYRVRFDTRVSGATRLEVVTEGVLTRMLQDDPSLEGTGLLIFDEFHERSLAADTGLALALESRGALRADLRLLVMSATIDSAAVARLLGGAPVVDCPGRAFPVETRYRPPQPGRRFDATVAATVREALEETTGDLLVFLPGVGEINRVRDLLAEPPVAAAVLPLHGSLPVEEQDAALAPGPRRRVVLATSIAETSLTIEGVSVVVDGGRMRVPRFSARTGMTRLETVRVSRASADQRRGRAGRTGPGICYRCWSEGEDAGLVPFNTPEILASDLAPLALDLAAAGVTDPSLLKWLDPPPDGPWRQGVALLKDLGALDLAGRLTPHGRRMATIAAHPRLAHLAVGALDLGLAGLAAELLALLGDRDLARRGNEPADVDLRLRVESLRAGRGVHGLVVDRGALHRARETAREWRARLTAGARGAPKTSGAATRGAAAPAPGATDPAVDLEDVGRLLLLAYPDRVAQLRPGRPGRFLLRTGRGASLPEHQPLARAPYLVIAALDDKGTEARVDLAAPVDLATIEEACAAAIVRQAVIEWNPGRQAVDTTEQWMLGAIVLESRPLAGADPGRVRAELLRGLAAIGVDRLPWSDQARRLRARIAFLHRLDPAGWPDVSDAALGATLPDWLGPHLEGARGLRDLTPAILGNALAAFLSWQQRARLDQLAPEHWTTPAGSRIAIDYADPGGPVLAARLQELFGLAETPSVAGGRVPLVLHLLSPAGRPVQVTRDLAGFWATSYFDVRKDLRGRYPKHNWPEDPLAAPPTRGARRRGRS